MWLVVTVDHVDRELQVKISRGQIASSKDARKKKKNVMEFYFSAVRKLTLNSPATVQAHFQHRTLLWSLPHLHINVPPKHPSSEGPQRPQPNQSSTVGPTSPQRPRRFHPAAPSSSESQPQKESSILKSKDTVLKGSQGCSK